MLTPAFVCFSEDFSRLSVECKVRELDGLLAEETVQFCKRRYPIPGQNHLALARGAAAASLRAHA